MVGNAASTLYLRSLRSKELHAWSINLRSSPDTLELAASELAASAVVTSANLKHSIERKHIPPKFPPPKISLSFPLLISSTISSTTTSAKRALLIRIRVEESSHGNNHIGRNQQTAFQVVTPAIQD